MSGLNQLMAVERQRELVRLAREARRGRPARVRRPQTAARDSGRHVPATAGEPLAAGAAQPRC
jgi:hypothetical protein